ncbi:hypothetical protein [Cupriavidus taiwanensis]|uniref:hypothetical protein n=1 Tax=Cupriavidus taiwanensis TaxID=164546 RepID=UPI000E18895A|nr:hypothetical protein [Cupriavidus taiwanensis]SPA46621.1 conserved hypothetical protein [Cupriavidus taiwanensis]
MIDLNMLDTASPAEEEQFFAIFERILANDDGEEAARHLREGRAIFISDPRYPGRAIREHPDGRRELMRLEIASGRLVVERAI